MIQLFTDTSANLPAEVVTQYRLAIIPFSYTVEGKEIRPDPEKDFDSRAYYNALREGVEVKTSMINPEAFQSALRVSLEKGDDVLYIGMSGGISGSAQAAVLAVQTLREEFPQRKIEAVDTLAASLGEGLLVIEAAERLRQGASFEEIVSYVLKERNRMCQYFTVDDLMYLKRGGRLGRVAAAFGTILKIKPLLTGDAEGKIVLCGRVRGRRLALTALADRYEALVWDKSAPVGIAHADDESEAAFLLAELKKRGLTGKCLMVGYEPVTGAHVGPGTVALFFFGKHK